MTLTQKRRVFITGGHGFIGRVCLPLLAQRGWEIHATTRHTLTHSSSIHWHKKVDLLNESHRPDLMNLMREVAPTHLLHLAWVPTVPGHFWNDETNQDWVSASVFLCKAFEQCGGERIVCAGTCAEYDWSSLGKDGLCYENRTPLLPFSDYAKAKKMLHEALQLWASQSAISLAWPRIFFPYGPGEHPQKLVASLCRAFIKGETAHCSEGLQQRDFLCVDDVADALVTLLEIHVQGAVNIGDGKGIAVRDVAMLLADIAERPDLLSFGAAVNEAPRVVADIQRLKNEVGWTPSYNLETGLRKTMNWWRKNLS